MIRVANSAPASLFPSNRLNYFRVLTYPLKQNARMLLSGARLRGFAHITTTDSGKRSLNDLEEVTQREFVAPVGVRPSDAYELHVARGSITRDLRQQAVLPALDRVFHAVVASEEAGAARPVPSTSASGSGLWSLFGRSEQGQRSNRPHKQLLGPGTKGIYLWGGTGTGKTWLMDLLFHAGEPIRDNCTFFDH